MAYVPEIGITPKQPKPDNETIALSLTKKELSALQEQLCSMWEAIGTDNIAMEGRQLAAILEYIIVTKT